jgi:hypothetical protein
MVGGVLGGLVSMAIGAFNDVESRVSDLGQASGGFLDTWVKKLKDIAEKVWKPIQQKIKDVREAVKKALDEKQRAELARKDAPKESKEAQEKAEKVLTDAKAALKDAEKAVDDAEKSRDAAGKIPGSSQILSEMLEALTKLVTSRVTAIIDTYARKLFNMVFKFIRKPLDILAQLVIKGVAAIPFAGAALAGAASALYEFGMSKLEDAAIGALEGVVERLLAKGIRAIVGPIFKVVMGKVLDLAYTACSQIYPDACPRGGKLQFSELAPKDQWIARVTDCPGRPVVDEYLVEQGIAARERILADIADMQKDAQVYAKDIADRFLARYGYSYDSWMAAVQRGDRPTLAIRAREIERGLQEYVAQMYAERRSMFGH